MTTERVVRYITLADDDQQPLGAVAYGGVGWTLNWKTPVAVSATRGAMTA